MMSLLVALVTLVALVAPVGGGGGDDVTTVTLAVDNGGPWGQWGDPEICPRGTLATGFQLKVESPRGFFGDDSGLNGVRLLCGDTGTVTSSVGPRGSWTPPQRCPHNRPLVSFRLRVEPPRGLWDDTAANSLDVTCAGGTVLEGTGGHRGQWGNWSGHCPLGWGVCGLRTLLEPPQRAGDDTGLNALEMLCCP